METIESVQLRQLAHSLVDQVPTEKLFLICDMLQHVDQEFEEVTEEERAEIEEGLKSLATERRYSMDEVLQACGLTVADLKS